MPTSEPAQLVAQPAQPAQPATATPRARLEDAEEHRHAERKLDANRGAARVDSQACEDPHVALR